MLLKYGRVAVSAYGGVMPNSIRPQDGGARPTPRKQSACSYRDTRLLLDTSKPGRPSIPPDGAADALVDKSKKRLNCLN